MSKHKALTQQQPLVVEEKAILSYMYHLKITVLTQIDLEKHNLVPNSFENNIMHNHA